MNLTDLSIIGGLIMLIGNIVGGYIMLRSTLAKAAKDVEKRVRDGLSAENTLLKERVERLEKDNRRLDRLVRLIAVTLKKTQGLELDIDGDLLTLRDPSGQRHVAQISEP